MRWISADDGRTCPTCAERNGVIYPINEIPAKPHINCRCRVEAVKEDVADAGESGKVEKRKRVDGVASPIERAGKGKPTAITHFDVELNRRQQKLLTQLSEYGSRAIVPKDSVNMTDLSALTAKTGDEFAMFTNGKDRLIIRGGNTNTPVTVEDAEKMAAEGYRWSGHTHPGTGDNVKAASKGDYAILKAFGQKESIIYDSLGRYKTFRGRDYDGKK